MFVIVIIIIAIIVFLGVYKFLSYVEYTEEYSYELQEIKDGTYAIYHSVSSNVPSHNYDVITVCYNDQIHMFQGTVNIQQTNDKPYIEITAKPHINYGDEITVFIPKGTVEFADNVVLCQDLAQNKMRSAATKLLTENRPSHTFFRSR